MWFKNCQIYELADSVAYEPEKLANQIATFKHIPCGPHLEKNQGWTAPTGQQDDALVFAANGVMLLCLKTEEKIIPPSVVQDELTERMANIEHKEGRKLSRREKTTLKEDVFASFLPRALARSQKTYAYIDTMRQVMVVDTASVSKADQFVQYLRKSTDAVKFSLPDVQTPSVLMTHWMKSQSAPQPFQLYDNCVLKDPRDEKRIVRVQKHSLLDDNIHAFLDEGYMVEQMSLTWSDQLHFTLKEDFSVTRLKFTDIVEEKASGIFTETEEQRFDANFSILVETLRLFLDDLLELFSRENAAKVEKEERTESLA